MLNPATDIDMSHIFAALGLEEKKYCCKTRLTASVQFHDLEVQNRI
jgi:DNA-directed RNA polymerase subunit N (RpoN/RPB10)